MSCRIASARDTLLSEVFLGGQCIVSRAAKHKIAGDALAARREWLEMMQLQEPCLATPLTALVDVRAAPAVALIHFASLGCANVPAALARCFSGNRINLVRRASSTAPARHFGVTRPRS